MLMTKNPADLAGTLPTASFDYKRYIVPAIMLTLVLLWLLLPDMAFAEDSGVETEMNQGLKYLKFFIKLFLYALVAAAFMGAGWWVYGAISDWRNKERNGTVGNIVLTFVISILAVGFITKMVDKGITVIDDKFKDAVGYNIQIQPPTLPASVPATVVTSRTLIS